MTYLLLYSKLGAKIADSSVSARLLFFIIYFFSEKFISCRKNSPKILHAELNKVNLSKKTEIWHFLKPLIFRTKLFFWRNIFDFPDIFWRKYQISSKNVRFPSIFFKKCQENQKYFFKKNLFGKSMV